MKCVVLLFLSGVVVSIYGSTIRPTSGSGTDGSSCTHQTDCGSGLCCVHYMLDGKKKRILLDSFFNHIAKCHPIRMLNESCMPFMTHDIFNHELYENHCPCEKGLECRGEKVDEGPHSISHTNPKCQAPEK